MSDSPLRHWLVISRGTVVGRTGPLGWADPPHPDEIHKHAARWYPDCVDLRYEVDPDQNNKETGRFIPGMRYKFQRDIRSDLRKILRYATKAEILAAVERLP